MALGGASSLPADAVTCGGIMGIMPLKSCDLTGEETRFWKRVNTFLFVFDYLTNLFLIFLLWKGRERKRKKKK